MDGVNVSVVTFVLRSLILHTVFYFIVGVLAYSFLMRMVFTGKFGSVEMSL